LEIPTIATSIRKVSRNSLVFFSKIFPTPELQAIMSKRPAEEQENGGVSLKGGDRPEKPDLEDEFGEFEDEFEDEYESEDEILEAGVDGRPDAEREAEEKAGE
jgi:hypothetical protein